MSKEITRDMAARAYAIKWNNTPMGRDPDEEDIAWSIEWLRAWQEVLGSETLEEQP